MSNVLRVAIVDPNDQTRESLKTTLLGMDVVWLDAECSRYEFFSDVIDQSKPDAAIISLDGSPERAIALMERLRATSPDLQKYRWSADPESDPGGSEGVPDSSRGS